VLAVIAHNMSNKTAKAWPGRKLIAEKTGLTPTMVSNLLLELRRFGHLIVGKEPVEEANNKRLNVYTWGKIDHETLSRQISDIILHMRTSGGFGKSSPERMSVGKVLPQEDVSGQESPPLGGASRPKSSPSRTSEPEKSSQDRDSIDNNNNTDLAGGDANPSPAPRKREAKPRTRLPKDWKPSTETVAWAQANYVANPRQILIEAEKFRDYHVSRGTTMADWHAAWRTWWGNGFHKIPRRMSAVPDLLGKAGAQDAALEDALERRRRADEEAENANSR
jgi:hypothetical protein